LTLGNNVRKGRSVRAPKLPTEGEPEAVSAAAHLPWSRAEALGVEWAQDVRKSLGNENRAACGGWPGTLSEARVRLTGIVNPWSAMSGRIAVTASEFESLAVALNVCARNTWRTYAKPERAIDDVE
jgi:hypothetical protein